MLVHPTIFFISYAVHLSQTFLKTKRACNSISVKYKTELQLAVIICVFIYIPSSTDGTNKSDTFNGNIRSALADPTTAEKHGACQTLY